MTIDPEHHVTVTHTRDQSGTVTSSQLAFRCLGDHTSNCHRFRDCTDACPDDCLNVDHPFVALDDCWIGDLFDLNSDATSFVGSDGTQASSLAGVPEGSGSIWWEYDEGIRWGWGPQDNTQEANR